MNRAISFGVTFCAAAEQCTTAMLTAPATNAANLFMRDIVSALGPVLKIPELTPPIRRGDYWKALVAGIIPSKPAAIQPPLHSAFVLRCLPVRKAEQLCLEIRKPAVAGGLRQISHRVEVFSVLGRPGSHLLFQALRL